MTTMIRMLALTLTMAAMGHPAVAAELKIGAQAPEFILPGSDGTMYKLSQFKGKTVVLEWFNQDCPYVHKFYDSKTTQGLQSEAVAKGVIWLTIVSSAPGKEGHLEPSAAAKLRADIGMANTALLLDENGKVGRAYSAKTTPHIFVISKSGRVAYQGAMDDRPSSLPKSLEGAQNYVRQTLEALEKGHSVKPASTTPYGCSIHY
jgi:peroxiredoxin